MTPQHSAIHLSRLRALLARTDISLEGGDQLEVEPQLRTPAQARQWLDEQGISVTEFARTHGLERGDVDQLLRSVGVGKRGKAHNAAVLLGMKVGQVRPIKKGASK